MLLPPICSRFGLIALLEPAAEEDDDTETGAAESSNTIEVGAEDGRDDFFSSNGTETSQRSSKHFGLKPKGPA